MICFECGTTCITVYGIAAYFEGRGDFTRWVVSPGDSKITHVRKDCQQCGWISFPTKIPGVIE
jgi:hypothetical protein